MCITDLRLISSDYRVITGSLSEVQGPNYDWILLLPEAVTNLIADSNTVHGVTTSPDHGKLMHFTECSFSSSVSQSQFHNLSVKFCSMKLVLKLQQQLKLQTANNTQH